MRLYLIRGRGAGGKARSFGRRRTTLSAPKYRPFRPLLFDARLLSQKLTVLDRQPVELARLLGHICNRLTPVAQRQQLVLTFQRPPQPLVIQGRRVVLEWIFSTIVDYILNDIPAHGTVSLTMNSDSDGNYRMSIIGTGPPSILRFISAPCPEVDDNEARKNWAEKRRGFSMAKLLLAFHGGHIAVKRKEDLGIDIKVWLPLDFSAPT